MSDPDPFIAVVNSGSATLKFSVLADGETLLTALVDRLGLAIAAGPRATLRDGAGKLLFEGAVPAADHGQALLWLLDWLHGERPELVPVAVGHRVVHGGDTLLQPVRITDAVIAAIEALIPLAPLHQPHNLAPIRLIAQRFPQLPQVACFDTAFHATQSSVERSFALPRALGERGIRRYGFHGLSYEYIVSALSGHDAVAAQGRSVLCHLGNGASMCAVHGGRSVASTMSFTALDGIPMGTRCGAIDPGVLLHLLQQEKMSVADLHDLLYKRSGLLGLSGISPDMRDLLLSEAAEAAEAVEYFCYRIARELGSLTAALGGLDALVFTGGIGEHAAPVRARICELSAWLGVRLDVTANSAHRLTVHAGDSKIKVFVIPTSEERMIARHVAQLLGLGPG